MSLHAIHCRRGWGSARELGETATRFTRAGEGQVRGDVRGAGPSCVLMRRVARCTTARWVRRDVLQYRGTVCRSEATGPEAIHRHARLADVPVDEIVAILETVVAGPDPVHAAS